MTIPPKLARHLTPSLFISILALLIATSTGAYAVATLGKGVVHTRNIARSAVTTPKLHKGAVVSTKVKKLSLRLSDLGGKDGFQTATPGPVTIPPDQCRQVELRLYNPAPRGVIGSLVVGHVTDAHGHAVLSNSGVVLPTMVSETSQGGAITNLVVCASGTETIPAGSIFHYHLVSPGR